MSQVWAFAIFAAVLTVTPGLDTMLVLRTTAMAQRRSGLACALGVGIGCLMWAVASALGVTALLAASRLAFDALRIAGVAYLFWLGARALWQARVAANRPTPDAVATAGPQVTALRAFRTGVVTNLLNPKVGVFYLSVMPQFLPRGANPLVGSLTLGAIHVVEGLVWLSLVVLVVNRARGWLTRPSVKRRLQQLTGVAFLGFGLRLALTSDVR